jgi:type IV secretion system protein VirB10
VGAVAGRDDAGGMARLPSDSAAIAVQDATNIAPSLRKAQGAEVSIFVAQDFDFSGVYGLKAR